MSLDSATIWTARLIALAVLLQTLELWQCRRAFSNEGVFRWQLLAPEHAALPGVLRLPFAVLLPYPRFLVLLLVRVLAAGWLAVGWTGAAPVLLVTQLAICVRFRGTFNGGSDYMTVIVLLGLSLALDPVGHPLAAKAGLGYVAVQSTLSYFIAGMVKLRSAEWRSGTALIRLARNPNYGVPASVRRLLARPACARLASLGVIALECGSPVIWVRSELGIPFVVAAFGLHLGAAIAIGLNRFLLAWAASYPALLCCIQWADSAR